MHIFTRILLNTIFALFLALPALSEAADPEADTVSETPAPDVTGTQKSIDQIAWEMSNPLATFFSFGYEAQLKSFKGSIPGADDQSNWTYLYSAVLPFRQKDGKGWVFRFALPYVADQPIYWADRGYPEWLIRQVDPTVDQDGEWGLTHSHTDAVSFNLAYGGVKESGLILQYGIAGILPTTSDTSNGRQQLILGPEVNIGKMTSWGAYGALISHIIDVAEKKDKGTPDTSQTTIQAYFAYGLGKGWQLISNPTLTYDWEGDSGNKLNLPLGGGIAKTMRIGKMPLKVTAEIQTFVASTDRFGPDWLFKFTIVPVLWNKYTRN